MILILTDCSDPEGPWLSEGLAARSVEPVELITIEELLAAPVLVHEVGRGGARFRLELADGRVLDSRDVTGVVNRIGFLPPDTAIAQDDAEYVAQERTAVWLSVLASLPGYVLNPPTPRGLSGAWRQRSEWLALAGSVGMPHERFDATSAEPISPWFGTGMTNEAPLAITLGDEVVDTGLPDPIRDRCRRLAEAAGTPMLGLTFRTDAGGQPVFVGANPRPDLRIAGDALLDALSFVFEGVAA